MTHSFQSWPLNFPVLLKVWMMNWWSSCAMKNHQVEKCITGTRMEVCKSIKIRDRAPLGRMKTRRWISNFQMFYSPNQGPLKKWTEHSLNLHILNIHRRGGSNHTLGLDGSGFFVPWPFIILKSWHQDLSNEGSNKFLISLELGSSAAQTWAFFDKFQILAAWSRAQKKQSTQFTEFFTRVWKISNWGSFYMHRKVCSQKKSEK